MANVILGDVWVALPLAGPNLNPAPSYFVVFGDGFVQGAPYKAYVILSGKTIPCSSNCVAAGTLVVKWPGNIAQGLGQGQTAEITVTITVDDANPPLAKRTLWALVVDPGDVPV